MRLQGLGGFLDQMTHPLRGRTFGGLIERSPGRASSLLGTEPRPEESIMAKAAPGAGVLRIGAGNVYVANKTPARAVSIAASQRAHSWASNESTNVVDDWRKRTGYSTYAAPGGFRDMRDAHDCVTMKRKVRGTHLRHVSFTQVCEDALPKKSQFFLLCAATHKRNYGEARVMRSSRSRVRRMARDAVDASG